MSSSASAPAKIILFGEHAVVYGQPAIAVPVSSLRATAQIIPTGADFNVVVYDSNKQKITMPDDNPLMQMAKMTFTALDIKAPRATLEIRSDIPIASGLGSGAAISAAMSRAIANYAQIDLSAAQLNDLVYETEKMYHGTPSGVDNTVIVYEKPVYFIRDVSIEPIINTKPLQIIIGNTGIAAPTKEAVSDVRRLYDTQSDVIPHVIEEIGQLVREAKTAMKKAQIDLLGQLMRENHKLLQTLTVSSQELDNLVNTAVGAGALGAKLSGGGRGGNMIALVADSEKNRVVEALKNAGATHVIATTVGATQ